MSVKRILCISLLVLFHCFRSYAAQEGEKKVKFYNPHFFTFSDLHIEKSTNNQLRQRALGRRRGGGGDAALLQAKRREQQAVVFLGFDLVMKAPSVSPACPVPPNTPQPNN